MTLAPDKRITITLGLAGLAILGVWYAAITFTAMTNALANLQAEVHRNHQAAWTVTDMDRWSRSLERENRASGMIVPDPRAIRP
jgi:hypothetical protein